MEQESRQQQRRLTTGAMLCCRLLQVTDRIMGAGLPSSMSKLSV
jgi:hypothetical protein